MSVHRPTPGRRASTSSRLHRADAAIVRRLLCQYVTDTTSVLPDANDVGNAAPTANHDGHANVRDDRPPPTPASPHGQPHGFDVVNVTLPVRCDGLDRAIFAVPRGRVDGAGRAGRMPTVRVAGAAPTAAAVWV